MLHGDFTTYDSLADVLGVLPGIFLSWSSGEMGGWMEDGFVGLGCEHKKCLPLGTALPPLTHAWEVHPAARGHAAGLKASHLRMN